MHSLYWFKSCISLAYDIYQYNLNIFFPFFSHAVASKDYQYGTKGIILDTDCFPTESNFHRK